MIAYYASIVGAIALPVLGVSIGQGRAQRTALEVFAQQPQAIPQLRTLALIGTGFSETAALMGALISFMLLFMHITNIYQAYACLGVACAVALPGFLSGYISALPTQAALNSTARQPFFSAKILILFFVSQAVIQAPILLGAILSLMMNTQVTSVDSYTDSLRLIATGVAMALGSIGPVIGLGLFSHTVCTNIGRNRKIYPLLLPFTFISQALIETPLLFVFGTAIIILSSTGSTSSLKGLIFLAAGCTIGLSTLGSGISSGKTAQATCNQITAAPELYQEISAFSWLSQTLIDTSVIYGFIISLTLLVL